MADRKVLVGEKIYTETSAKKVVFGGKVYEETLSVGITATPTFTIDPVTGTLIPVFHHHYTKNIG